MPDGGCQGQDALGDAGGGAGGGASLVALEVELVLEGVEDGLDDLADLCQCGGAGSGLFFAGGGAQHGDAGLGQIGLQGRAAVALVHGQDLAWLGGQVLEGVEQGLALVGSCAGQGPGHRQAVGCGDQVQAQAPEEARVGGAVPVLGPPGQLGSLDGGAGAGALDGGGVGQPQGVVPDAGGSSQGGDEPGHGAAQGAQALVPSGLARDTGKHGPKVLAGVTQPVPLAGVAQQGLHDGQGDDLGIAGAGNQTHAWSGRGEVRVGDEQIVDGDVQCGGEGLQVGVHESCLQGATNRF